MQLGWGTDGFWMGAGWIQDGTRTWADGDWDAAGPGCMQMVGVRMQLGCTGIEHGWGWGDIRTQVDGDRNAAGLGLGCRWERVRCSRLGSGCGQFGVRMQLGWDENGTRSDGDSDADGSGMEHGWVRDGMRTRADGDGDAAGARSGRSRLLRVRAAWGEDAAGMGPRWAGVGPGEGEGGSRCGDVPTCAPGTNATRTLVQSKVPRTEPPAPRCRTPRAASRTTSPTGRDGTGWHGTPSTAGSVPPIAHPPLPGSTGRAERPPRAALMAEDFARRAPPGPPRGPRSSARHCRGGAGRGEGRLLSPCGVRGSGGGTAPLTP